MSSTSHLDMHREHAAWRREDNLWRDELSLWEREIEQAINDLPRLEKALRDQARVLRRHAASIRLHEQEFCCHEHALACYEQGETPSQLVELSQAHEYEAEKHAEQYSAHVAVKGRQHVLMSKWRPLIGAVVEDPAGEHHDSSKRLQR